MPLFSVIVPVYNTEKYLNQCVEGVLNQTLCDIEVILVDDGSTDNSPKICDAYARQDTRIKVIHKENGGLSSARNAGLDVAIGQYIVFIDSDDFYHNSNDLWDIYLKLNQCDTDILIIGQQKYFQSDTIYVEKRILDIPEREKDVVRFLMENNIFIASACDKIYSRQFIEKNGLRFVLNQKSEDIEWCIKLLLAKPKIEVLSKSIYVYRKQNANSITANIGRKNITDISGVLLKYIDKDNIYVKHFLAVQYVQLLAITNLVESKLIKDILIELKALYYLLQYTWYPYVRKIRKLKRLGFNLVRKIIGVKLYTCR